MPLIDDFIPNPQTARKVVNVLADEGTKAMQESAMFSGLMEQQVALNVLRFLREQIPSGEAEAAEIPIQMALPLVSLPPGQLREAVTMNAAKFLFQEGILHAPRRAKGVASGLLGTVRSGAKAFEAFGGTEQKVAGTLVGKLTEGLAEKLEIKNPKFIDEVAKGFGSLASFYIPGVGITKAAQALAFIPRLAPVLGVGASTLLESFVEAGSTYESALSRGDSEKDAHDAAAKTLLLNIPATAITNRLGVFGEGTGVGKAAFEGAQEAIQQVIGNYALGSPDIFEGVPTAAGVGAVTGGGLHIGQQTHTALKDLKAGKHLLDTLKNRRGEFGGEQPTQPSGEVGKGFVGKAFRVESNLLDKGKTAQDIVNFEATELGNTHIKEQAESLGIDLTKIKGEDVKWVTANKEDAKRYGKKVQEISLPGENVVLATDGEGGYLVAAKPTQPSGEPFFTKAEKAVEGIKQAKFTPDQARAALQQQGGFRDLDKGLFEQFVAGKKTITKADLTNFVNENKTRVETQVRTTGQREQSRQELADSISQEFFGRNFAQLTPDETIEVTTEMGIAQINEPGLSIGGVKYGGGNLVLPGGENYQETTFSVPSGIMKGKTESIEEMEERLGLVIQPAQDPVLAERGKHQIYEVEGASVAGVSTEIPEVFDTAEQAVQAIKDTFMFREEIGAERFTSHAFDDVPNNFGWLRHNERTDAEGNKVFFIEEAQKVNSRVDNITEDQIKALPKFATTGFTEFAVKQAIQKAIDSGSDVVAWTTGEQQADRYDLSKQASRVYYLPETQRLVAQGHGGETLVDETVPSDQLDKWIPKETVEKLFKKPLTNVWETTTETIQGHDLQGEELKVGGEQLKQFYDRSMPRVADKYIKTLDPEAKVEEITLPNEAGISDAEINELNRLTATHPRNRTEGQNQRIEELGDKNQNPIILQPGFRITPKMKQKVLTEGQPLSFNIPGGELPEVPTGGLALA